MHTNYHVHSRFCDGVGEPEEYVLEAIKNGLEVIGFSSHTPMPIDYLCTMDKCDMDEYLKVLETLKEKYKNQIQIYTGLEVDYLYGIIGPASDYITGLGLDYTIGSVHSIIYKETGEYIIIDAWEENFIDGVDRIGKGDPYKLVEAYYEAIEEMVKLHKPDIIGHFDIIKKNNKDGKYFDENTKEYRDAVLKALRVIKEAGSIVEINTGGKARGKIKDFYPSDWILKECFNLGIEVMVNSDAHNSSNINSYFKEAVKTLKDIGYTHQKVLYDGLWKKVELVE